MLRCSAMSLWDPMDHSLPDSSVHGIFQARILEWVAISFSKETTGTTLNTPTFALEGYQKEKRQRQDLRKY